MTSWVQADALDISDSNMQCENNPATFNLNTEYDFKLDALRLIEVSIPFKTLSDFIISATWSVDFIGILCFEKVYLFFYIFSFFVKFSVLQIIKQMLMYEAGKPFQMIILLRRQRLSLGIYKK